MVGVVGGSGYKGKERLGRMGGGGGGVVEYHVLSLHPNLPMMPFICPYPYQTRHDTLGSGWMYLSIDQ